MYFTKEREERRNYSLGFERKKRYRGVQNDLKKKNVTL